MVSKEGAFDEALKDVDAIEHMATPVHFTAQDPLGMSQLVISDIFNHLMRFKDLIRPAVQGTVGILKSAKKNGCVLLI